MPGVNVKLNAAFLLEVVFIVTQFKIRKLYGNIYSVTLLGSFNL